MLILIALLLQEIKWFAKSVFNCESAYAGNFECEFVPLPTIFHISDERSSSTVALLYRAFLHIFVAMKINEHT